MPLVQKFIVEDAAKASPLLPQHVAFVNPDGSAWEGSGDGGGYVLPAAKPDALGGVKQAASVAAVASADAGAVSAADAAAAAAETITKAEFDAVVTLANECKAKYNAAVAELNEAKKQVNALLSAMGAAGQMAPASRAAAGAAEDAPEPVDEEGEAATDGDAAQEPDETWTVPELRALAVERGVEIPKGAKKSDILKALGA